MLKSKIISSLLSASIMLNYAAVVRAENDSVDEMIANMTTKQKIAQMHMPSVSFYADADGKQQNLTVLQGEIKKLIEKYPFSGVILYAMNITGTEQTVRLTDALQKANAQHNTGQLFISTDQEGGKVSRITSGTQFAGNMALGAAGNARYAFDTGAAIGEELKALGINTNFAPVVDVNNNPRNPVIGVRSFSDDPDTVAEFGVQFMKGLGGTGIISTLKHFPGHGDTDTDSHTGLPCITKSYDELKSCELIPFKACVENGAEMIMTVHIQYPNIEKATYTSKADGTEIALPATLSKTILTDILRGDMGYDGVIVTDAMEMDAIKNHFDDVDAAILAINAGADILLGIGDIVTAEDAAEFEEYLTALQDAADSGKISIDNINASVKRILKLKESRGLLEQYNGSDTNKRVKNAKTVVGSKSHHDTEWEITKKAITLVRNNNSVLPLTRKNEKTVILTAYENEAASIEYAKQILAEEKKLPKGSEIVTDCFRKTADKAVLKTIDELKSITSDADNVIMITELNSADGLNPANTSNEAAAQGAVMDELITSLRNGGKRTIQISCNLPYDAVRYDTDAVLLAWSPRGMSENPHDHGKGDLSQYGPAIPAAVYMAFAGDTTPKGKLPVNIPAIGDDYKFTEEFIYERGAGLEYSILNRLKTWLEFVFDRK